MGGSSDRDDRGRQVERPRDLPKRGWRDILLRTKNKIGQEHVSLIAAGIAFYSLLAVFPAIAAGISLWALALDPQQIEQQIASITGVLPPEAARILQQQAQQAASGAGTGLRLAAIFGILFAFYSASKGVKALMDGLNVVYREDEKRGFIKLNLVAILLTVGGIVAMVVTLGFVAVVPALIAGLGFGSILDALATYLRWPILLALAIVGLGVLYRFGPSRENARWEWVSWGAIIATVLWLVASIGFSIYVRNFASYNEVYGSLGAVIILLMWLWLSSFIVLLGAALNAEMEHQTARDTTTGPGEPLGRRGAHVADTVGESP